MWNYTNTHTHLRTSLDRIKLFSSSVLKLSRKNGVFFNFFLNMYFFSRYPKSTLITSDSEIPALWSLLQRGPTSSSPIRLECFLWLRFTTVQMVYSSCWARLPLKIYGGKHVSIEVSVKIPITATGIRFHS